MSPAAATVKLGRRPELPVAQGGMRPHAEEPDAHVVDDRGVLPVGYRPGHAADLTGGLPAAVGVDPRGGLIRETRNSPTRGVPRNELRAHG